MRRLRLPRTSATKATPQASLSFAGAYRPVADGTAEDGTAAGAGGGELGLPAAAGAHGSAAGGGGRVAGHVTPVVGGRTCLRARSRAGAEARAGGQGRR